MDTPVPARISGTLFSGTPVPPTPDSARFTTPLTPTRRKPARRQDEHPP